MDHVRTGRRSAGHRRIAITARAVTVGHAGIAVHAIGTGGPAAIGICFHPILEHIHTRGSRARHCHGIAETARAVAGHHAAIAIHAIGTGGPAAIGICFHPILEHVHAGGRRAQVRHGIAETAHAIVVVAAHLAVHAIARAHPAAIDVRFRPVLFRVRAARCGAGATHAYLADAIAAHHAHLRVGTRAAHSAAAIDVRFHAILDHVATLGRLAHVGLTHAGHAVRARIAFHAHARGIAEFPTIVVAHHTQRDRRKHGRSIGTRILRTILVVAHRVRIEVSRRGAAIAITNDFLAIARSLSARRGRIQCDVFRYACAHDAVHGHAFIP